MGSGCCTSRAGKHWNDLTVVDQLAELKRKPLQTDCSRPDDPNNDKCIKEVDIDAVKSETGIDKTCKGIIGHILTVEVIENDLINESTDAITNCANESL